MSERNIQSLTKAQLIEEIDQLRNSDAGKVIAELQDKVASLEEAAKSGASSEELEAAKASLSAKEEEVASLQKMVEELTAENADLVADKGNPHPLVKVDGVRYKIKCGAKVDGKKFTPTQIAENPEVAAILVKKKSPVLEPFN